MRSGRRTLLVMMRQTARIVAIVSIAAALAACGDTWKGAKKDTGENVEATGKAIEDAGKRIKD